MWPARWLSWVKVLACNLRNLHGKRKNQSHQLSQTSTCETCAYMRVCMEVRGQPWVLFLRCSLLFLRQCLTLSCNSPIWLQQLCPRNPPVSSLALRLQWVPLLPVLVLGKDLTSSKLVSLANFLQLLLSRH